MTGKNAGEKSSRLKIITASDLHYLSPDLMGGGELFSRLVLSRDAKAVEYCEELCGAFFREAELLRPDAVILSGDLSFNGEAQSHIRMAEKLSALSKAGICVLVTTGNHDVYNKKAASFAGAYPKALAPFSGGDFEAVYGDFGYGGAQSRDAASLSFTYRISDSLWVLMLDANTRDYPCGLSPDTLRWIEAQLKAASRAGARVIAAGHQNLFKHSIFDTGYVMEDAHLLYELFERYGVRLFLSGHMHIQHILTKGGVTEIATSALPVAACQYGLITIENDGFSYESRRVDVGSWAAAHDISDGNLLRFSDYTRLRMDEKTRLQTGRELSGKGFSAGEKESMIRYACEANFAYFSGNLGALAAHDPDGSIGALWEKSGTFTGRYLSSVRAELGQNHTRRTGALA